MLWRALWEVEICELAKGKARTRLFTALPAIIKRTFMLAPSGRTTSPADLVEIRGVHRSFAGRAVRPGSGALREATKNLATTRLCVGTRRYTTRGATLITACDAHARNAVSSFVSIPAYWTLSDVLARLGLSSVSRLEARSRGEPLLGLHSLPGR